MQVVVVRGRRKIVSLICPLIDFETFAYHKSQLKIHNNPLWQVSVVTDNFREVHERVSAESAARYYGITVNQKGQAICPFHPDTHPSMTFKNGRFRCWSCNESGDSIDLVSHLLGLSKVEAVNRLNSDFALGLHTDRAPTPAEQQARRTALEIARKHEAFEAWRHEFINLLNAACRAGHFALQNISDVDRLTDADATAIRVHECFEYWAHLLGSGTPQEQAQIYRERRAIAQWIEKVLKNC